MRIATTAGLFVVLLATVFWVRSSARQVQAVPGPGSGIITVNGTVDVANLPPLDVGQRGPWAVSIANAPDVRVTNTATVALAPASFLKIGGRYVVIWPVGETETIRVAQLGSGAWVNVEGGTRRRWVNLAVARAVEEIP